MSGDKAKLDGAPFEQFGGFVHPTQCPMPIGGTYWSGGLTLRDWFAAQALMLAHADYAKGIPEYDLKAMFGDRMGLRKEQIVAAIAGRYADAMVAERSKP